MTQRLIIGTRRNARFLAAALFLLTLACFAGLPRVSYAQCCANETAAIQKHETSTVAELVTQVTHLSSLVDLAEYLNNAFDAFVQWFRDLMSVEIATLATGQTLQAEQAKLLHQDKLKFETAKEEQSIIAELVGRNYKNPKSQIDCYTHLARLGMVKGEMAKTKMSDSILRMVGERDIRSKGMQPVANIMDVALCPKAPGFTKGLPSATGAPAACTEAAGSDRDGMPLSVRAISGRLLEWPDFKTVTIDGKSYKMPDPKNDAQQNWVEGAQYMYVSAGHRSGPPNDSAVLTAKGVPQTVAWSECAARESALVKPCADLMAYYTRPNCQTNRSEFEEECKESERVYRMAELAKFNFSSYPDFKKTEGLSPFQAEYLATLIGLTPESGTQLAASGASSNQAVLTNHNNAQLWMLFQIRLDLMEQSCILAMGQLAKLDCYPPEDNTPKLSTADKDGGKGAQPAVRAAFNADSSGPEARKVDIRALGEAVTPRLKAGALPKGEPVAADEIDLPETVAQ